jgi:multiple sugar transport system ATP-binding protein
MIGRAEGISAPISFEHVVKRYGGNVLAVDDLNLTVDNGELMVLLGPSGCGKTTSLRMLAGLETITSGTIRIGETIVNQLPPRSRNVAMVFQSYALYAHLSVYDNLAYPLRIRKLPRPEIDRRVREVADLIQIGELLRRKPREISGGQRQRVALGRAIIRQPSVFLMDEPLSNLDAKLRLHMRAELKRFQRDLATTTIYVTHDQAEAMTLADRIAIMSNGVLQQVGTPKEVYHRPASMFVAGFLGSPPMNFLRLDLSSENGQFELVGSNVRVALPSPLAGCLASDGPAYRSVVLGVRPEDVAVSSRFVEGALPAEVYVFEDLGNERLVTVQLDDEIVVARVPGTFETEIGAKIWVSLDPARLHLFDSTTEKHISL